MSSESSPFLPPGGEQQISPDPIYVDKFRSKNLKMGIAVVLGLMGVAVVSTIIAASVQSYLQTPLYVLLLINVLGVSQVPIFMTYFVFKEHLTKKCIIAVFVVAIVAAIEAVNTDIIVLT